MPKRSRILFALLLLAARHLSGQSFQKEYAPASGGFVIPYSAAQRPDGKFLVSHSVNDDSIRLHVTCLEPDGAVAWSVRLRAHPDITGNEGFVEGPITATSDNGCVVMVSKSYQSQVVQQGWALVKLGPDGTVQWNRQIAGVGLLDDLLEYSGGLTFVAGRYPPSPYKRYVACLTHDGTMLWEKDMSSDLGTIAVSGVQALPGKRILLMLRTENASLSAGHLIMLDEGGNVVNLLSLHNFTFIHARAHPDGRLFFLGNTADNVVLGMLQAGLLQWAKVLDLPEDSYSSGALAFNSAKDSLAVSFQGALFEEQRLFIQFDLNGNFSKGHYLPSREGVFNKLLETPDGGLAWASFSKTNPLRAFVFSKTHPNGQFDACPARLLCEINVRDTTLQPLPAPAWTTNDVSHSIVRQAASAFQMMTSSDYCAPLPVFDAVIFAADTTACAGDTLFFRRDSLTTGASTWTFEQGSPDAFYGPEPPGIAYPDTGHFNVRHVLEQAGCRDTARLRIRIGSKPEVAMPKDTLICPGSSVLIVAGGDFDWKYRWNDGDTLATQEVSEPGGYTVTATNSGGCTDVGSVLVKVVDFPQKPLPNDTFSCENTPVLIGTDAPAGWKFAWGDGFPDTNRLISSSGVYTLLATSPEGCSLADSIRVGIVPCPDCFFYFPNVIRPASGDENASFGMYTGCSVREFSLLIFDRWGTLLFESNDPQRFWDGTFRGKVVLPGVYIFRAEGVLENANSVFPISKNGAVTVLR